MLLTKWSNLSQSHSELPPISKNASEAQSTQQLKSNQSSAKKPPLPVQTKTPKQSKPKVRARSTERKLPQSKSGTELQPRRVKDILRYAPGP